MRERRFDLLHANAKAWLRGKLMVALLVEKVIRHTLTISAEDTTWRQRHPHSPWRDFRFALKQVTRSIEAAPWLEQMIEERNEISESLAEAARTRSHQGDARFSATKSS